MKKAIKFLSFLFLAGIMTTTVSCSSDDGESTSGNDPIIGKWKAVSETEDGVEVILDECELMEVSEFKADGTADIEDYDMEEGECQLNELPEGASVTWEKNSTDNYTLKIHFAEIIVEEATLATEFSNGNNQMKVTTIEAFGDEPKTIVTTFIRQ